jgi:hypothetical protein
MLAITILPGLARAEPWPAADPENSRGCVIQVFWDAEYGGESWTVSDDTPWVGDRWNDQISSVKVIAGLWDFYWDAQFEGEVFRTGPGDYSYVGDHWNDQLSSFRCEHPTRFGDRRQDDDDTSQPSNK